MQVPIKVGESLELDEVVEVKTVETTFVSLEVDDASNFFGGGILSSNSIYGFRGARPDLFTALDGKEGWKTRQITTNYRCEPEIVEAANSLIANNEGQIPMEAKPNPKRERGQGSMVVETAADEQTAAVSVVNQYKEAIEAFKKAIADIEKE